MRKTSTFSGSQTPIPWVIHQKAEALYWGGVAPNDCPEIIT